MSRRTLSSNPMLGRRKPARNRRSFAPIRADEAALEARQLLTTASLSSAGVLTVTGTSGPDTISVDQYQGYIFTPGGTFFASSVKSIVINGLDGDDSLGVSSTLPTTLNGGSGRNTYNAPANDTVIDPTLTGGVAMSKAVMDKYQSLGGSNDLLLGKPTGDEVAASGGRVASFQGGEIDYSAATGAHEVHGAIYQDLVASAKQTDAYGTPVRSILGLATSDEAAGFGGRLNHFQGGDIQWSAATGPHAIYGAIDQEMNATANEVDALGHQVRGFLGLPTSDEAAYTTGGRVEHFQGGDIYYSAATGAHVLYGSILAEYNATAGETDAVGFHVRGILGLPTSDEAASADGRVTHFSGGDIFSSAAAGTHVVYGAILAEYNATAGETDAFGHSVRGILGLPTSDELTNGATGRVEHFQGGDIYYSLATGAHVVYGADLAEYNATAGEVDAFGQPVRGILGLPTADETTNFPGRVEHFQGGDIYYSATTGAHVVYGADLAEYNAVTHEVDAFGLSVRGILGLPTADEAAYATTGRVEHFQGGDIYYSLATGAHVLYGSIGQTWKNESVQTAHLLGLPTADEAAGPEWVAGRGLPGREHLRHRLRLRRGREPLAGHRGPQCLAVRRHPRRHRGRLLPGDRQSANAYTDPPTENLMYKLINGDAANATYQGIAVGNLSVNSPAWKVNDLELKWFEGEDHPVDRYNLTNSDGSVTKVDGGSYRSVKGPLFGAGGPAYTDVDQGSLGDCYFLVSLAETAYRNPQLIRNMFTDNGDGTYTVRFFSKSPDYETVDRMLPSGGESFDLIDPGPIWSPWRRRPTPRRIRRDGSPRRPPATRTRRWSPARPRSPWRRSAAARSATAPRASARPGRPATPSSWTRPRRRTPPWSPHTPTRWSVTTPRRNSTSCSTRSGSTAAMPARRSTPASCTRPRLRSARISTGRSRPAPPRTGRARRRPVPRP